jgi:hypothetical protein
MLCKEDREDLKWACQAALLEASSSHPNNEELKKFILEEATYEQILNLACNPYDSKEIYFEAEVIEVAESELFYEFCVGSDLADVNFLMEQEDQEKKKKGSKLGTAAKVAGAGAAVGGAAALGAGGYLAAKGVQGARAGGRSLGKGLERAGERMQKSGRAGDIRNTAAIWLKKVRSETDPKKKARYMETYKKLKADSEKTGGARAGRIIADIGKGSQMKVPGADTAKKLGKGTGKAALIGAGIAAATIGAYMLYRKLRKAGKSQSQAAQAAASKAQTPEEKAKWSAKAKEYKAQGK